MTDSAQSMIGVNSTVQPSDCWWLTVSMKGKSYVVQFHVGDNDCVGTCKYFWDFGDGATSTRLNPKHTYKSPGVYILTLWMRYEDGSKDVCQGILQLGNMNPPEVACTSSGNSGAAPYTVKLSAMAMRGMKPYTYLWNTGDKNGTIKGSSIQHTYKNPGVYLAVVTVTDSNGLIGVCVRQIRVTGSLE